MLLLFTLCIFACQSFLCSGGLLPERCFDELPVEHQCFEAWSNALFFLPESPSDQNITINLYVDGGEPVEVVPGSTQSLLDSGWDSSLDSKVIVHGFIEYGLKAWVQDMAGQLTNKGYNVFFVDWATGASGPNYFQTVANARVVGVVLAQLVAMAARELGYNPARFHCIGQSLGAHICGYTGKELKGSLGRISATDAAAQGFLFQSEERRLDKGDALFVDAIHTNIQTLLRPGFGLPNPVGDVDFYVNGAHVMPGCLPFFIDISNVFTYLNDSSAFLSDVFCSHDRAALYYLASINDAEFVSCRGRNGQCTACDSDPEADCPSMGFPATSDLRGKYYTRTGAEYPFSLAAPSEG